MKKYILALFTLFFGLLLSNGQNEPNQFEKLDLTHEITEVFEDGESLFTVSVSVIGRSDKIEYQIYKDSPIEENLIKKSRPINQDTYSFNKLTKGKYFIIVYENKNRAGILTIYLGN